MNSIQPSTDNLYKFLATSGVALLAMGIVTYWNGSEAIREKLYAVKTDDAIAKVDYERWRSAGILHEQHSDSYNARSEMFLERFSDFLKGESGIPEETRSRWGSEVGMLLEKAGVWGIKEVRAIAEQAHRELGEALPERDRQFFEDMEAEYEELVSNGDKHMDLAVLADKEAARVKVENEHLNALRTSFWVVTGFCVVSILSGVVISSFGFWVWWRRFQRLQDRILANQARATENGG